MRNALVVAGLVVVAMAAACGSTSVTNIYEAAEGGLPSGDASMTGIITLDGATPSEDAPTLEASAGDAGAADADIGDAAAVCPATIESDAALSTDCLSIDQGATATLCPQGCGPTAFYSCTGGQPRDVGSCIELAVATSGRGAYCCQESACVRLSSVDHACAGDASSPFAWSCPTGMTPPNYAMPDGGTACGVVIPGPTTTDFCCP